MFAGRNRADPDPIETRVGAAKLQVRRAGGPGVGRGQDTWTRFYRKSGGSSEAAGFQGWSSGCCPWLNNRVQATETMVRAANLQVSRADGQGVVDV